MDRFDTAMAQVWPPGTPQRLREAGDYSLTAGGKRLRPQFALASCEAVCGSSEPALPFACALEMIHTYSLIHDDLPAMDNDDFRRGRPTNHKVYGDGLAILAGDALLTEAFAVIARADLPAATLVAQVRELALASGSAGMVGGQVLDIEATGKRPTEAELIDIHRKKTGALFAAAVTGGALAGGAPSATVEALRQFAFDVGLAFQIIDDVLDVTQDLATLGKPPGSDQAAGKVTYVDILGLDVARERAHLELRKGLQAIALLPSSFDPVREIARRLVERDR
jgi:geranylgeranyl diphosphate synthase type II